MANPAFSSRSDCPLPFIPEIDPDLIQDCEIPPIPDPFFEAPAFPPIIPPITLGCPPISVSASVSKVKDKKYKPSFSASAKSYDPDKDNCFPLLEFDLRLPYFCPEMSVSVASPKLGVDPQVLFNVVQNVDDAPDCEYEFQLDLTFPCTSMSIRSQLISKVSFNELPSLNVAAELDTDTSCLLNFDIEIAVPALDDVGNDCTGDGFLVGGDLYVEGNILYFSCSKVALAPEVNMNGSGDCIEAMSLQYLGGGSLVLDVYKTSCTVTYC